MARYSTRSEMRLQSCHLHIQRVLRDVLGLFDHTVIEGHRTKAVQNQKVHQGLSQVRWPDGMHNRQPSLAVDIAPYPIDWNDRERFVLLAGVVLGVAHSHGIKLRWGGDWDRDMQVKDNNFDDLGHFELVPDGGK